MTGLVCWHARYLPDRYCLLVYPISYWQALFACSSNIFLSSLVLWHVRCRHDKSCLLAVHIFSWHVLFVGMSDIFLASVVCFEFRYLPDNGNIVCWHVRYLHDRSCLLACQMFSWQLMFVGMSDILLTYFVCWHVRYLPDIFCLLACMRSTCRSCLLCTSAYDRHFKYSKDIRFTLKSVLAPDAARSHN